MKRIAAMHGNERRVFIGPTSCRARAIGWNKWLPRKQRDRVRTRPEQEQMRILIVHNTLNDSRSVSGVLRHYAWMANEWIAAGHQTDFVVASCGFPQLRELAPHSRLFSSNHFFDATRYLSQTWRYFPPYAWRMAKAHR